MKKYIALLALAVFMVLGAGCSQPFADVPLEAFPAGYTLRQAKADGCVTHENGAVTQGKELFEAFYGNAKAGRADTVRLAFYDTPGEDESGKEGDSALYIQELSFDGKEYTIRWYEGGEEIRKTYAYLMKYEGQAESPYAVYASYVRYVLTNDDTVTWQEVMHGMVSSQMGDYIDHQSVCTELFYE